MKKLVAILLSLFICFSFSSCTPLSPSNTISFNDDANKLYYNGRTYVNYNNSNGKYHFDVKYNDEHWVNIATRPYGIFYIMGAVTEYYGNTNVNPDFIICSRTIDFYVREDITFDHSTKLSLCDAKEPYCFKIADVITENSIEYSLDKKEQFAKLCTFIVALEKYPFVKLWVSIYEYNHKLYLQDVWDSDYYEITNDFKEDIYQFGVNINKFDYL